MKGEIVKDYCSYEFSGIRMGIAGVGLYADALRNYFGPRLWSNDSDDVSEDDLLLVVHKNSAEVQRKLGYRSLSGKITFNESVFSVVGNGLVYSVTNLFGEGNVILDMAPLPDHSPRNRASALYHATISGGVDRCNRVERFVNQVTNYGLLWYVLALVLMKKDKVFVHSGMMAQGDNGLVISGTSGCGKTSTMMEMLQRPGWRYLAEDFGVIDCEGRIWSVPKKAAVYQSDVRFGNKQLVTAVGGLSPYRRIRWNACKAAGGNPCFHFSPEELFGVDGVAVSAQLKCVVFFARVDDDDEDVVVKEADVAYVADRIASASFREIKELYELLTNIRAVAENGCRRHYPTLDSLYRRYLELLVQGIGNMPCFELRVPDSVAPGDLATILLQLCS